ncbi:hypothetical protein [Bradyrhizobium sp. 21]|uniref:hypothetical protein n=1 Tax=Bradyrhizobium sp. 21 TaxID=2782666 RepID=UPI001FF8AA45|nr:hypothetical protein [Bradyrhizobium sp. 21]
MQQGPVLCCLYLSFALLTAPSYCFAQEAGGKRPVGLIVSIVPHKGKLPVANVVVVTQGKERPVSEGDFVSEGNEIIVPDRDQTVVISQRGGNSTICIDSDAANRCRSVVAGGSVLSPLGHFYESRPRRRGCPRRLSVRSARRQRTTLHLSAPGVFAIPVPSRHPKFLRCRPYLLTRSSGRLANRRRRSPLLYALEASEILARRRIPEPDGVFKYGSYPKLRQSGLVIASSALAAFSPHSGMKRAELVDMCTIEWYKGPVSSSDKSLILLSFDLVMSSPPLGTIFPKRTSAIGWRSVKQGV